MSKNKFRLPMFNISVLLVMVVLGWVHSTKAAITIVVTGDGNNPSTWTISGSGTSSSEATSVNWTFSSGSFVNYSSGFSIFDGPGTMAIAGTEATSVSPTDYNLFTIDLGSALPSGSDLSTTMGSFVNTRSPFLGGLAPGTTLTSDNSTAWGTLTITSVPEPAATALMFGGLGLAAALLLRHKRTPATGNE